MRKKAGEKKVEASARTRKREIRAASLFSPSSLSSPIFFFLWRSQSRAQARCKLVDQNPNCCLRFLYRLRLQSLFRFLVYVESCKQLSKSRAIYNPVPWALFLLLKPGLKSTLGTRLGYVVQSILLNIVFTLVSFGNRAFACTSSPVPISCGKLVKNPYFELHMNLFPFRVRHPSMADRSLLYCLKAFCISPPGWFMTSFMWSMKLTNIRHCLSAVNQINRPLGQSRDSCGGKESGFKP